jgi:hypothetical protein
VNPGGVQFRIFIQYAQGLIAAEAGLSHLEFSELSEDLGEEGVIPSGSLELSAHGAF